MPKEDKRNEDRRPTKVHVFNNTTRMLSVGLRRKPSNDRTTPGPSVVSIDFLPGNNLIDAAVWAKCKEVEVVQSWLSAMPHRDRTGRREKFKYLIEGHHDTDFTEESSDLSDRMKAAREAQFISGTVG